MDKNRMKLMGSEVNRGRSDYFYVFSVAVILSRFYGRA
jgi:hypothetical protein